MAWSTVSVTATLLLLFSDTLVGFGAEAYLSELVMAVVSSQYVQFKWPPNLRGKFQFKVTKMKVKRGANFARYSGKDIRLLREIITKMNGTASFLVHSEMNMNERNPWRHTNDLSENLIELKKKTLTKHRIDLMNSEEMLLDDALKDVTESLYPHSSDDMRVITYKSDKIPSYMYIFMLFSTKVWLALVVSILFGGFGWWKISRVEDVIRSITGGSIPVLPNRTSGKLFFATWMIYTVIIMTAFTSKLTSILLHPKYYPECETLDDVEKAGITVLTFQTMINLLLDSYVEGEAHYNMVILLNNVYI